MCGIAGLLHADAARPGDAEGVRRMCRTLLHRGPDGDGFLVDGPAALGMRRLAIIDVQGGDQPLYDEDRRVGVLQNGEIYNYLELRCELESHGHVFRTHSDTEVIAHAYEQWGDDLVQHLNGMWAFASGTRRAGACSCRATGSASSRCTGTGTAPGSPSAPRSRHCSPPACRPSPTGKCSTRMSLSVSSPSRTPCSAAS